MEKDNCCRTCKWNVFEWIDLGNVCVNKQSEHYTDWTDNDEWCEHYESEETEWQAN